MIVRHQHANRRPVRSAFTLMEVMIVAAILVVLAGAGTLVMFRYLEDAKENTALTGVKNLESACKAYKLSRGDWPPNLEVLCQAEGGKPAFLEERALLDPWDRPYVYEPSTLHPQTGTPLIFSQGVNPGDPTSRKANWN